MPQVLAWSGLVHHCRETVLAAGTGEWESYRWIDWTKMLPKALLSAICDLFVLAFTWSLLHLLPRKPVPLADDAASTIDLAYVFPFPLAQAEVGGAMSHVRGFLSGLARVGGTSHIYSACPLVLHQFPLTVIPNKRRFSLFPESITLSFNVGFACKVYSMLRKSRPRAVYQRHRRFTFAGALLSRWLRVPLILEFNGSEVWMAQFWDSTRFPRWLKLCEEFSLACASMIVVVSDVLRDDLVSRGLPIVRIVVNPNGVDADYFRPNCGGEQVRAELALSDEDVVAGFVGTFSYWHGVEVLQKAILKVLDAAEREPESVLKFLLIGEGPLFAEMKKSISDHPRGSSRVIFTGSVAHDKVPSYLDATDILLSPHVPMPDGRRFFGSPTKLFEYMAMAKGIVASRLDQLAVVLEHQKSALLVTPGDPDELLAAMLQLAADPELRIRLGRRAREEAVAKYTWAENAGRVLEHLRVVAPAVELDSRTEISAIKTTRNGQGS